MRKALTNENQPVKEGSGRRYWMRASPVGSKATASEIPGKRGHKARFLEPYRLSEERRSALIQLLASGDIGDREGRELFASAIEYDIANARQVLARQVPAPEQSTAKPIAAATSTGEQEVIAKGPALPMDLAHTARSLAEHIAGLEGSVRIAIAAAIQARDPYQRAYDGSYLDALGVELKRIADAVENEPAGLASVASEPPAPAALERPLGEGARRFLRRVARVYEEVLESAADPSTDGTFESVLRLVSEEAGIALPRDPADLAGALLAS